MWVCISVSEGVGISTKYTLMCMCYVAISRRV